MKYYRIQIFSEEKYIVNFTFIDISKIKIAENTLIKNHINYEKLLESSHVGVLVIQKDRFIYANPIAQTITEHTMDELLHKKINELIITEEKEFDEYFDEKKVEYVKPYFVGLKVRDNKTKWLEISATDIEWNQKKSVLLFLTDITKKKESEDALIKSEHRKNSIIKSMDDTLIILDLNLVFKEFYTPNIKKLFMNPGDFLGKSFTKINFPKPAFSILYKALLEIIKTKEPQNVEYFLKAENNIIWFNASITLVEDTNTEILVVIRNINKIKEIEFQLEKERKRLENIIDSNNIGTWEWNVQTGETIFNERWAEIVGYTLDELKPINIDTWLKLIHPEDVEKSTNTLNAHFRGESNQYECEVRMKHKKGNWVWVLDKGKALSFTPKGEALIMFGTHTDITERKAFEREIIEISIRDPLTNIYNRRHIFSRLNEIKAKYERDKMDFSIAILDIDYFKRVNDNFGHLAGDFVLQEFTKILGKNIRPFDLLGRFGGEEFIIIMLNCQKDTASLRIEDILKIIRNTNFIYRNQRINFTFSAGISDSCDKEFENLNLDRLIDSADKKLYLAKKLGRNRIVIELEE